MADLTSINANLAGKLGGWFKAGSLVKVLSFFFLGVIILGGVGWYAWYRIDKKVYNKKIKAFPIINGFFSTNDNDLYRDTAKSVKLGKGGFEILYLKKLKTWKLAQLRFTGRGRFEMSFAAAGFVTFGLSVIMSAKSGLLNPIYVFISLAIAIIGGAWLLLSQD